VLRLSPRGPPAVRRTGHWPRHCEELLRRSNPGWLRGEHSGWLRCARSDGERGYPGRAAAPHHVAAAIDRI